MYPWGWSAQPAPNQAGLRTLARKFGYFTGYEACQSGEDNCIYMTDGTTDDFAYGELGVAAYTFELGTSFFEDCSYFEANILPQALDALAYAVKVAGKPYQLPAGPDVVRAVVTPALAARGQPLILSADLDDGRTLLGSYFGTEPIQAIAAATYTVDAPGWIAAPSSRAVSGAGAAAGAGVPMQPVGLFDTPRESATADDRHDAAGPRAATRSLCRRRMRRATSGPATAVGVEIGESIYVPYVANGAPGAQLRADDRVKE